MKSLLIKFILLATLPALALAYDYSIYQIRPAAGFVHLPIGWIWTEHAQDSHNAFLAWFDNNGHTDIWNNFIGPFLGFPLFWALVIFSVGLMTLFIIMKLFGLGGNKDEGVILNRPSKYRKPEKYQKQKK